MTSEKGHKTRKKREKVTQRSVICLGQKNIERWYAVRQEVGHQSNIKFVSWLLDLAQEDISERRGSDLLDESSFEDSQLKQETRQEVDIEDNESSVSSTTDLYGGDQDEENVVGNVITCIKTELQTDFATEKDGNSVFNDDKATGNERFLLSKDPTNKHYGIVKIKCGDKFIYECNFCGKQYNGTMHVKDHIEVMHLKGSDKKKYDCKHCNASFTLGKLYRSHLKSKHIDVVDADELPHLATHFRGVKYQKTKVNGQRHFKCSVCDENFGYLSALKDHINMEHLDTHDRKVLNCKHCEFVCFTQVELYRHEKRQHQEDRLQLKIEQGIDVTANPKIADMNSKHYGINKVIINSRIHYMCQYCQQIYKSLNYAADHINSKHLPQDQQKRFSCPYCEKVCLTHAMLLKHMSIEHYDMDDSQVRKRKATVKAPDELHDVEENATESSPYYGIQRMRKEGKLIYFCKFCNLKQFSKIDNAQHHVNSNHKSDAYKPNFICDICGKSMVSKRSLKRHHEMFHGGAAQKWQCDKCPYSSPLKANLKAHQSSCHSEEQRPRPFLCDQCPYQGFKASDVRKHILNTHTNKGAFVCTWEMCDSKFNRKSHLETHMAKHQGKLHQCIYCGFEVNSKPTLIKHIKEKHPDMPMPLKRRADKLMADRVETGVPIPGPSDQVPLRKIANFVQQSEKDGNYMRPDEHEESESFPAVTMAIDNTDSAVLYQDHVENFQYFVLHGSDYTQ